MERLRNLFGSATAVQQGLIVAGVFIVGFIVLGVISIGVWEATNSLAFCANVCHDVHPEEPSAYQDSYHAEVQCVECHMGRVSTLRKIVLKASHARHLPETLFRQYERPTEAKTLIPPDQSCERCHWPPSFHGDTVREIDHYSQDRQNSLIRTYLALRTGSGGARVQGAGKGIHWHIANEVEFIPTGEDNEDIRWVRATFPDGSTVEYNDVTDPLTVEEIAAADPEVMSCVDCHNRIGHPFYSPDTLVDLAMQTGRLSSELPYAKEEMMALLTRDYESQEQAFQAAKTLQEQYETQHPEVAQTYQEEIEQAVVEAKDLLRVVVFEEEGVTWESFPDHTGHGGHKPFAGCFRCHNGTLQSNEGEPIRIECSLCHSIPEKVGAMEQPPELPAAKLEEPLSHQEVDFLADHRWQADEACGECHGEISFGTDDSSFCANSACHGEEWPQLNLDPTQEHPIPLEGGHDDVWCHDCHEGTREPEYRCANCHEPPPDHYGDQCEDCHTPMGWESISLGEVGEAFEAEAHPFPLDHGGADSNCAVCHPGGDPGSYTCFTCHSPETTRTFHEARDINDIFAKCTDCHS
jgi:nitrate/TMAO reductase-like tetraheme cytochrome c subunit